MKKPATVVGLAILWTVSGLILGAALDAVHFDAILGTPPLTLICAVGNVVLGLLALSLMTSEPPDSEKEREPGLVLQWRVLVSCLLILPVSLLIAGLVMWLVGQILRGISR